MDYEIHRLAAGSYDLVHDGAVMGSVVRAVSRDGEAVAGTVSAAE